MQEFDLDEMIGTIWISPTYAIMVIGYEECGCSFTRAVLLSNGSDDFKLMAERDDDLLDFIQKNGLQPAGKMEVELPVPPPKKTASKKRKASRGKR